MSALSDEGQRIVGELANQHGFSVDAVTTMLHAVSAGYGTQAQFSHPEFGGMGQWSAGGMTMIGDMFNNQLAGRVAALAQDISSVLNQHTLFAPPPQVQTQSQRQSGSWQNQGGLATSLFVPGSGGNWWPAELGAAGSTGAQNDLRYAYFPAAQRLAINVGGQTTVYDTGPHQIGGFSQQQSGDQSLTFTSQLGLVRVSDLPVVNLSASAPPVAEAPVEVPVAGAPAEPENAPAPEPAFAPPPVAEAPVPPTPAQTPPMAETVTAPAAAPACAAPVPADEIFTLIEKLADLHAKGVLTDAEFEAKKAELLGRI